MLGTGLISRVPQESQDGPGLTLHTSTGFPVAANNFLNHPVRP